MRLLPAARLGLPAIAAALVMFGLAEGCAGSPPCELNSDCTEGFCVQGECKIECADSALDCPIGYVCTDLGRCEFAGEGGASSTSVSAASGGGGAAATSAGGAASSPASSGAGAASSSSGGVLAQELETCSVDADCVGGLACKPMTKGGTRRCTRSCSSHSSCPQGMRCIDEAGQSHCRESDIGRICSDASACNFACQLGPNYCTDTCASGADCPSGYGCMEVGTPATRVCVRAEALCDGSDSSACITSAACDLSPTLILGSCTLACNSAADCPQRAAGLAPWTCDGLCRRPGDVYGPLPGGYAPAEYHCDAGFNAVNLCNDAQHIDFQQFTIPAPPAVDCGSTVSIEGVAGDACVNTCRFQGGCSYGFACVAVGNINGRIGLCLPTGSGEPGAACTSHTDCAFGYCVNNVCSRDCTTDGLCPGGLSCVDGGAPPVESQTFRRCE